MKNENGQKHGPASVKDLIAEFKKTQDKRALFALIVSLMDAMVCVPMTVTLSEADTDQFLHAKAGDTVQTQSAIRMRPDFLKDGEGNAFFPAFTDREETEEGYRNSFSWITMPFLDCCRNVAPLQDCCGIVINGFSDPFVVDQKLIALILQLKSEEKA